MRKMTKNQDGLGVIGVILVLVALGLIGFFGFMAYKNHSKTTSDNTSASSPKISAPASTKPTTTPIASPQEATITGNASYPGEGLPPDEKVCAVVVTNSANLYCDNVGARQGDLKFSIKVPAGDYYVYATAEKELPNYKAYYDDYSKCGNSYNCPATGHKQYVIVTAAAGATIDNVAPSDWYAN